MVQLGITEVFKKLSRDHKKLLFDFEKVVFTQVCSRFIKPVSKLALDDNWLERMYPGNRNYEKYVKAEGKDLCEAHLSKALRDSYEILEKKSTVKLGTADPVTAVFFQKVFVFP